MKGNQRWFAKSRLADTATMTISAKQRATARYQRWWKATAITQKASTKPIAKRGKECTVCRKFLFTIVAAAAPWIAAPETMECSTIKAVPRAVGVAKRSLPISLD